MRSLKQRARIAGLWYLGFALGPFYLLYVPSRTVVQSDAAATATRVLGHQTLYRWGMITEAIGAVMLIGLGLALYRLFEEVDRHRARQVVALALVSSALGLVGLLFEATAFIAFRTGEGVTGFDKPARAAIGLLLIRMHAHAYSINQTFWGLWLLPLGWLFVRSRFLPRWLGHWLLLDGVSWVIIGTSWLVDPTRTDALYWYFSPAILGELVAILWLVIVGAKEQVAADPATL